jgi:DNA-binding NtrC family response regulator
MAVGNMESSMNSTSVHILVVDDNRAQGKVVAEILQDAGYVVEQVTQAQEGLRLLNSLPIEVVLTDLKMPGMDGLAFLEEILRQRSDISVILMTAYATIETAVAAMKKGAFDYLVKPLDKNELVLVVERAVKTLHLNQEVRRLRNQLQERFRFPNLIGNSRRMKEIFRTLQKVKDSDVTILIYGESGTGKEMVAQAIHFNSPRKEAPFIPINCAAIPETLLESELFGYERGAFTGANTSKKGLVEAAHQGTLFLDEIGDLSLPLQAKILRMLQEKEIRRVGSSKQIKIDVRIIAATNKDLQALVQKGEFREDLYYRLNVISIHLPPLRERKEDIPLLIDHFIHKHSSDRTSRIPKMSPEALTVLMNYDFPGNIRQLESIVERILLFCDSDEISVADLPREVLIPSFKMEVPYRLPEQGISLEELEKSLIFQALERAGGVYKEAAKLLGLSYKTFLYRAEKYGLKP